MSGRFLRFFKAGNFGNAPKVYEWMRRFAKIASHSAKMERPVVLGKCK